MTFCKKCGVEIMNATSSQKLCGECRKEEREKKNKRNKALSEDVDRARAFKMTYGEYRQFSDKVKGIK